MFKLATMMRNPGEPEFKSRYDDPKELVALGYTGRVFYETTALSGVARVDALPDGEVRRWAEQTVDTVDRRIHDAAAAGLAVYLCYDALVLARSLVERDTAALTCKKRPQTLCPASDRSLRRSMEALSAMLDRWPQAAGVVLRFGDSDARRLPHLMGNDLYTPHCSRCSQTSPAQRVIDLVQRAYDCVVNKHDKRLIVRAWNVRPGGMHDTPALAEKIIAGLPGDPADDRLVLSFKFTQTDFWRYQAWNQASLRCGGRPVIYELQCQREFEGKGGIPNWQVPLWRDGDRASCSDEKNKQEESPTGLAAIGKKVNVAGVMAWVRGGGWGGPFVGDESWIDANVFAASRLADDPQASVEALAQQWVQERLQITEPAVAGAILAVLDQSPELIRQGFYVESFARTRRDGWHPAADWIGDDQLDAEAAWRLVRSLPMSALDAAVEEKRRASESASRLHHDFQHQVGERGGVCEAMLGTLLYTESFFEALRDFVAGLAAYRRYEKSHSPSDADEVRRRLLQAQSHWNHHTQRHANLRGVASPFREVGLWELTQQMIAEVSDVS